eukprot:1157788-Pelagomonas_calceolata.AAC.3
MAQDHAHGQGELEHNEVGGYGACTPSAHRELHCTSLQVHTYSTSLHWTALHFAASEVLTKHLRGALQCMCSPSILPFYARHFTEQHYTLLHQRYSPSIQGVHCSACAHQAFNPFYARHFTEQHCTALHQKYSPSIQGVRCSACAHQALNPFLRPALHRAALHCTASEVLTKHLRSALQCKCLPSIQPFLLLGRHPGKQAWVLASAGLQILHKEGRTSSS